MQLLQGKTALILGMANTHSISWGIARALRDEGAELAITYRRDSRRRHLEPLAALLDARLLAQCDAQNDDQLAALVEQLGAAFGGLDIIVHAAVGASPNDLSGAYMDTNRASFLNAMDASVYTLIALVQAARELLRPGACVLTLSYHGARQVVPNYNVMGVAKAALEASVRYMAADLGSRNIRVNAISAGPIKTLSASGISGFRARHKHFAGLSPLGRTATIADVGRTAAWLCSDAAMSVTGETIYVDAGLHHMAAAALG